MPIRVYPQVEAWTDQQLLDLHYRSFSYLFVSTGTGTGIAGAESGIPIGILVGVLYP